MGMRNSKGLRRRLAWAGALALLTTASPAQLNLPDIGDSSETVFSSKLEREVGEAFMRQVRAQATLVSDPEIVDYVQSLGYRLSAASSAQRLGFTFFVLQERAINAFAAPGGYVGINTGLILASETESELAAVVAHEIAHVTQRHIARSIELSEKSSIAALAGLLAAVAIGFASPEAGQAAAATVLGTTAQNQLNFSRANEQEADRVGMQMLYAGGFDPIAMAGFFEKLQTAGRFYRQPPEYLSTHPVTTSRIADAQGRARQYGTRQHEDSLRYRMVRAKLRLSEEPDNEKLMAALRADIERAAPTRSPGLRYALALAHARAEQYPQAIEMLDELRASHPDDVPLQIALAEVRIAAGERTKALAVYSDLHGLMPDSRLVTHSFTEALLKVDEPKRALEVLTSHRRFKSLDAAMYRLEADALSRLGRRSESQAALAEYHYRQGNLIAAIQQLKLAARGASGDFYRASRIEARIEELERERAELTVQR